MKQLVILSLFVLGPLVHAQAKSDRDLLQGTWVCTATLKDGKPVTSYVGVKAKIEGDTLYWYFPQKDGSFREQKNKYTIDAGKNPKHFDWWKVDDSGARTGTGSDLRLYTVSETELRMATNLDYKTRPASFERAVWQFTCKRTK